MHIFFYFNWLNFELMKNPNFFLVVDGYPKLRELDALLKKYGFNKFKVFKIEAELNR
jgi:hypothetical protein